MSVFNASGLANTIRGSRPVAATICDYSEWRRDGPPPALITFSALEDGAPVETSGKIGDTGGAEGLATRDGALAIIFEDKRSIVVREGGMDTVLDTQRLRVGLTPHVLDRIPAPRDFFFEGVAAVKAGYVVLVTVRHDVAESDDDPGTPMALFLAHFKASGALDHVAGPIRYEDGRPYSDYGGALAIAPSGLAIVPGFYTSGMRLVAPDGRIVADIDIPTRRVEGVDWDPTSCRLSAVRECVGEGFECDELEPMGVPLWIARPRE